MIETQIKNDEELYLDFLLYQQPVILMHHSSPLIKEKYLMYTYFVTVKIRKLSFVFLWRPLASELRTSTSLRLLSLVQNVTVAVLTNGTGSTPFLLVCFPCIPRPFYFSLTKHTHAHTSHTNQPTPCDARNGMSVCVHVGVCVCVC